MADRPKKSEQGEVDEPQEIAAEDVVGGEETPTPRQQEREQAIVDEPVAESEQRIAEATAPAGHEGRAGTRGGARPRRSGGVARRRVRSGRAAQRLRRGRRGRRRARRS